MAHPSLTQKQAEHSESALNKHISVWKYKEIEHECHSSTNKRWEVFQTLAVTKPKLVALLQTKEENFYLGIRTQV